METTPPLLETECKPPQSSLWSRLFNIFAAPGEVFEELKSTKLAHANWLAPVLLFVAVGIISSVVVMSQPSVIQHIHEQQQAAFDKQVKAGKMTQAQADQAAAMAEKFSGPSAMILFGCIGSATTGFALPFWSAFLLWLIARFYLKVPVGYLKLLELVGLSMMILALAGVIKTLLIVITGNLYASTNALIFIKHFDPRSPLHNVLALFDLMTFWLLAVRSIGLARLTGASFGKAAVPVFGVWFIISGLIIGFSLAMQAIFAK